MHRQDPQSAGAMRWTYNACAPSANDHARDPRPVSAGDTPYRACRAAGGDLRTRLHREVESTLAMPSVAPLAGITVLDLTNVLAGPFACYQLACLGARVVKVERRAGDLARRLGADPAYASARMGISFLAVNAGKESIALDFKHADGKAVLLRLVERADALVEDFRPGVMARLGLDYPKLARVNPRLVYCAISCFGQTGPFAHRPAYDQIIQGLSGVMSVTGDADSAPLRVGYPVCDTLGGLTAAFAVCAALVRARAT